jgi:glycosyltransferase involved in cell wall biosynthesis
VVDNGCSDEMAQIVRSYGDPRIVLVRQKNNGYAGGVMAAAAAATGDYFAVLDSDDQLMPSFVEVMLAQVEAHPELAAVGCDAHLFRDEDGGLFGRGYLRSIGARVPHAAGEVLTVDDVVGGRVPYYTGAIRRDAWDAVGGYQPGVEAIDESVLIWLRLASAFQVRLLPDRLARYRVRDDSLSHDPAEVEQFERALMQTFEGFAASSGNPAHARIVSAPLRRLRYHQELRRARWAFAEGDDPRALAAARRAVAQRRTARAVGVVVMMRVWPGLLRRAYPVKRWATDVVRQYVNG